jgi:hypothetical protein
MINKKEEFEVLNYYDYPKYLPSMDGLGYKISGQTENEAGFDFVTFNDIRSINQKSEAFRNGTLEFAEDVKEGLFKELRIDINNDNYFTRKMIEDIILDPNDEKMIKIVHITSKDTIDNFRRMLVKLTNDNEYDISNRVREYIDGREYELNHKITKSTLPIPKSKIYIPIKEENIEIAVVPENKEIISEEIIEPKAKVQKPKLTK